MAREALGVVGAAVGFVVSGGNPLGAQIGFTIGSAVGGLVVDPGTIKAPTLNDAPIQTSRDGVPRTIIWGLHYCHGNVIQKNPETQVTTTESQGKGGGPEVENTRRFRTFAIRVCEGPASEITRIFENNRLVYDVRSSPAIDAAETTAYAENITIYLGTEDQLPDPELESHWGADDTPAYKGTVYIVWNNYDLTDYGGAIPQFAFEVNGSRDATITSKPYPIEDLNGIIATPVPGGYVWQPPREGVAITVTPKNGSLDDLQEEIDYEDEGIDVAITPKDGTLDDLIEETEYEAEGVDPTVTPKDATLEVRLISHEYEDEGIETTITPKDGTLI